MNDIPIGGSCPECDEQYEHRQDCSWHKTKPDVAMFLEINCPELYVIYKERQRQVTKLGYSAEHDDCHNLGQMATAAAYYAQHPWEPNHAEWPFDEAPPKKLLDVESRISDLIKAAALIVAEIQRLKRTTERDG